MQELAISVLEMIKLVFILLFPGILFSSARSEKRELLRDIAYMLFISLSYWIISAWIIKSIGMTLSTFFWLTIAIVITAILLRRASIRIALSKSETLPIIIFLAVMILKFIPYFTMLAGPGVGDMTEHTYPVQLILMNDGIPDSYEPLLPIQHFGAYAAGFHTLAAIISLSSDIEPYRATFLLSILTHILITLGFYALLRRYFPKIWSMLGAALVSLLTTYPQLIFHWGGNPTVLSFFFILMIIPQTFKLFKNRISNQELAMIPIGIVASMLTHSNPFITYFYLFAGLTIIYSVKYLLKKEWSFLIRLAILGMLSLLLAGAYFNYLHIDMSKTEMDGAKRVATSHSVYLENKMSDVLDSVLMGPIQSVGYTSIPIVILSYIGVLFLFKNYKDAGNLKKDLIIFGILFVLISLLLIDTKYWFLPMTYAFRPDRISMFFTIIYSVLFTYGTFNLWAVIKTNKKAVLGMSLVYLICFAGYYSSQGVNYYRSPYNTDRTHISVSNILELARFQSFFGPALMFSFGMHDDMMLTEADLAAMRWIEQNTNITDKFFHIGNDASKWIPAIAKRQIFFPQVPGNLKSEMFEINNLTQLVKVNPKLSETQGYIVDIEPLKKVEELKARGITHVYIGNKFQEEPAFPKKLYENDPENYALIYQNEGVRIFKLK